jgi:hypothetical protein
MIVYHFHKRQNSYVWRLPPAFDVQAALLEMHCNVCLCRLARLPAHGNQCEPWCGCLAMLRLSLSVLCW